MKGKKSDNEFVSNFIVRSIREGFDTQDKIVSYAKVLLQDLDEEIKKIEEKKAMRSKLLDVIASFEKPIKSSKTQEAKILSFFQIQHPHICKYICHSIKNGPINISHLNRSSYLEEDFLFCIKQLIEHKVISKVGEQILQASAFEDYMKFVLREG